jgi:hypothetical protein
MSLIHFYWKIISPGTLYAEDLVKPAGVANGDEIG